MKLRHRCAGPLHFALILLAGLSCSKVEKSGASGFDLRVSTLYDTGKLTLGEKNGDMFTVLWNEGDKLTVNGIESDPLSASQAGTGSAVFHIDAATTAPYRIVYPSSSYIDGTTVNLPSKQRFHKSTFDPSAAICYCKTSTGTSAVLKPMVSFLRLRISGTDGIIPSLSYIRINGNCNERLSGDFSISPDGIMPTDNTADYVQLYGLSLDGVYLITIPGDIEFQAGFTVEVVDRQGHFMRKQTGGKMSFHAGVIYNLPELTFVPTGTYLDADTHNTEDGKSSEMCRGYVRDNEGKPLCGVPVTDGRTVVCTDKQGHYAFKPSEGARYVYYCTPSAYEINYNNDGYPDFYKDIDGADTDFTLVPLSQGSEKQWILNCIADPQVTNIRHMIRRLRNEVCQSMKSELQNKKNVYSMILGDLVWNRGDEEWDAFYEAMKPEYSGTHFFAVPGNHDFYTSDSDTAPAIERFTRRFGPDHYSFDRGDVHIVAVNTILPHKGETQSYDTGLSDEDYKWLIADLSLVPRTKAVVLCSHISLRESDWLARPSMWRGLVDLLGEFNQAHVLSGHLHYNLFYTVAASNGKLVYGHSINAAFGSFGNMRECIDGTPAAHCLFSFDGARMTGDLFKSFWHDASYQMRCYDGGAYIDGDHMKSYGFGYREGTVVVNVFNASGLNNEQKVELYQNGIKCCDMKRVLSSSVRKVSSVNNARWKGENIEIPGNYDWWYLRLCSENIPGYVDRANAVWTGMPDNSAYFHECYHLYYGNLNDPDLENFEVRVTDRYGNVYTSSETCALDSVSDGGVKVFRIKDE